MNIFNNPTWGLGHNWGEFNSTKIANISFKQPYKELAEVENKSDFSVMLGVVDKVRTSVAKIR
jgi:hypothetical protein